MTHLTDMAIQVAATKLVPFSYGSFEMQVDENNERVQPAYQPNARALQAAKEVLIAAIPYLNLSPAEPVDQWQDIATAPKDGTPILVHDGSLYAFVAEFNPSIRSWVGADNRCWEPTHWIPLPDAPTSKGGE